MNYADQEVIRLTQDLVRIESTNVGTFEGEISLFIEKWLRKNTCAEVMRDEFAPGRFNVYATVKGRVSHPNLIYCGHMDTVPAGNGWTRDPFDPVIEGDRMYGRGACDMKSGLAAAMIAFRDITNKFRDLGTVPACDFVFFASGDEEDAMLGADRAVDLGIARKDSLFLDIEPTVSGRSVPSIAAAHKGKTWFEITTTGIPGHGSMPWTGADAIIAMSEVVLEIRDRLAKMPEDPVMGASTVCFGTINGGTNTNMVADKCTLTIDMRLAPPLTNESSIQLVEDAIAAATAKVPGTGGSQRVLAMRPYVEEDPGCELIAAIKASCRKVLGKEAETVFITGYTDSGVVAARTGCVNAMSFGPDGAGIHQADEYVLCDTVLDTLAVISDLAEGILFK